MTAENVKDDCYSAKVVNCMVLGFAAMMYRGYKNFVYHEHIQVSENNRIVSHLKYSIAVSTYGFRSYAEYLILPGR